MHWIVAGFLMFGFSIPGYLLIRKATRIGLSHAMQNMAAFIVPLVMFLFLAVTSGTSLVVSGYQLFVLVVSAVLFSYLGAKLSLLGMQYAPNPGYSLVISKSYVVFTTLFAVLFFQATLTLRTAIAIAMIVLFSALVIVDPKKNISSTHVRDVWLPFTMLTFLCWGMLAISSKYLLDLGVPIYTRLIYIMTIVSILFAADMKKDRVSFGSLSKDQWIVFILIGICFTGFNYFMQLGYQLAPNIGYINALNAASIAAVTIGAAIVFKDELNIRKFTGVIGVIAGLILLVF